MLMKVSELNRLFGSLLDQFVSSFARADVLASFEFDSDWFIDFSFSVVSFEGQVCENAEYDRMIWAIGMAVLYTVKLVASSALSWLLILPIKEQQR